MTHIFHRPLRAARVAAAGIALLLAACGGPQRYSTGAAADHRKAMEARIAAVLAQEALAVAPHPARVGVIAAATNCNFGEEHARLASALAEHFREAGAEALIWSLPGDAHAAEEYAPPPIPLTGAWIAERVRAAGGAEVVISLVDAPAGAPAQLPAGLPPLVCLAQVSGARVPAMMRAGAVKAAIVPRNAEAPAGAKDWFDLRYVLVHPDTVDGWTPR